MAKITIDGKTLEVDASKNLLEECLSNSTDLPYFCWHPAMGSVGSCRQCAVIEYANDEDERGRLVMACMTAPRDGARYSIEKAEKFRSQAIEAIMINHPHDCPVCEEGGECHLQDMTVMSGHTYRRFDGKKKTHNNQYLGPFIGHEMNRCITCYRCVRFYRDYAGGTDFGPQASHDHTYFGRWQEGALESEFSGNLAEVCPTGVFTDKVFSEQYARKWDLQTAPSVCAGCSVGCNITPGERYGTLRRVVNRFNDEVNGYFICDRGRFGTGYVNSDQRIKVSMSRDSKDAAPFQISTEVASQKLQAAAKNSIGIGSPRASLEANFALRKLVGAENFYAGVDSEELSMLKLVAEIYHSRPVNVASIKDIEASDAVVILGEDVTNTAARISLALRQSVRNLGKEMAADLKLPEWQDAAIRTLTMDSKSPLYIISGHGTRLDDIAKQVHIAPASDAAKIGKALAHALDASAPAATGLSDEETALVKAMAEDLKAAKQPLVISGTSSMNKDLIEAAANIATALSEGDAKANLALVSAEANSMGLALLMHDSNNSLDQAFASGAQSAIVLENDLYRRASADKVDHFINGLSQLAVLDHLQTRTGEQANLVLAAGPFAEVSGTYVNYETRAQHFYAVYPAKEAVQSSAHWLSEGSSVSELLEGAAEVLSAHDAMSHIAPGSGWTFKGMRAPRMQHRYSGRTSMLANISVHEPKQPQDPDGVMNFSMEGVPQLVDATVFNTPWAPGWNSNQSVFKFQDEAGGALSQASSGEKLINSAAAADKSWFDVNIQSQSGEGYSVVPLYHLFGSEELTAASEAIQQKSTAAYVALNPADASSLGLVESDGVELDGCSVPYLLRESIRPGTVGVSAGLDGLNIRNLGNTVKLEKAASFTTPSNWMAGNIIVSDKRSV